MYSLISAFYAAERRGIDPPGIKRIAKNSRHAAELKLRFAQGETPSVITIFGKPQPIDGLPTDWEQTERFFFPSEQPILVIFNWYKTQLDVLSKHQSGTAYNVGTLADLREWLATEKEQRKFWVGTFIVSCVSIGSILLRFKLQT